MWRTEGHVARSKQEHGRYIFLVLYRVSQTHRGASQYKADAAETESYWLVEKLRRTFKCHRSSLDFDFKFIRDA